MGQDLTKSITPPPLSLTQCLVDGQIDIARYIFYRRRIDGMSTNQLSMSLISKNKSTIPYGGTKHKRRTLRSVKRHKLLVRDDNGEVRELLSNDTRWYQLYVQSAPYHKRALSAFRLRFRMPYQSFIALSEDIEGHDLFCRWTKKDAVGEDSSNIKLLLLGCLRYIGRSWTLDDIEEANGISREVNRNFIDTFLEYGSTILYKKWVIDPAANRQTSDQEKLFKMAGFNGCIGSSDATHVGMLSCPAWTHNMHKGFKLNIPSRTYNVTVDHSRKILGSTEGHPATWNDKSLILFDRLISNINQGIIPNDYEFMLYEHDDNGNIVEVCYYGVWFMVDNGYLSWSCTVPPYKDATTYKEIRFSEWLESMRKDVECTFGILKGRFVILRYGVRFQSIVKCDKLWLTCLALHNMLIDIDGLDKNWDTGVPSDWEIISKTYNKKDDRIQTPFAIQRLKRKFYEIVNSEESSSPQDECDNFKIAIVNQKLLKDVIIFSRVCYQSSVC